MIMKSLLAALMVALIPVPAAMSQATRDARPLLIFDGKTFTGWEGNLTIFRIDTDLARLVDPSFVRRYDAEGQEGWTRQFGTAGGDNARDITVDESSRLLVTGSTEGALPDQTSGKGYDAFVARQKPRFEGN